MFFTVYTSKIPLRKYYNLHHEWDSNFCIPVVQHNVLSKRLLNCVNKLFTFSMELLLPSEIDQPADQNGLILGTQVQSGKYLITHFVKVASDDVETIIGYCEQIATRLIGGVDIVGCYNHSNQLLTALKKFTPQFVAVTFEDKISAKMYAGNKVSRSDVKQVQSSKYPTVLVKSSVNFNFSFVTGMKSCVITCLNFSRKSGLWSLSWNHTEKNWGIIEQY